jgi:hypothetical protein
LHKDKESMKDSKLINFKELKQAVIAQSVVAKKAPKSGKVKEESDSFLKSFF